MNIYPLMFRLPLAEGIFLSALYSALLFAAFRQAGLRGVLMLVCLAPVVGEVLGTVAFARALRSGHHGSPLDALPLLTVPLALLPLLILAFKSWPPVGMAPNSRSET